MATPKKAAATTKKAGPNRAARRSTPKAKSAGERSPAELHQGRVTRNAREAMEAAAEDLEVSSIADFKKAQQGKKLLLPSGFVCRAKNPGMMAFLELGFVPNSLLGIVTAAMEEGKPPKDEDLQQVASDPAFMLDTVTMVNAIVCHCVVSPKINAVEVRDAINADEKLTAAEKEDKINSMLFVDEVDLTDKMFVYNWASGGTADLETFRDGSSEHLARILTSEDVGVPSE